MKYLYLPIIFIFLGLQLRAQTSWGKVDPEQFDVKHCPFDSTANAMLIVDSSNTAIDFDGRVYSTTIKVYKRIQVLNKNGLQYASVTIPLFGSTKISEIDELDAQTLNVGEKGKVKITKVKDEDFYSENLTTGFANKKFAFPDVKEGSVLEYRYTLTIKNTPFLRDWSFQSDIPVVRSALRVKIPETLTYSIRYYGNLPLIKGNVEKYTDVANSISGIKEHYALNNVPAYKSEPYVGCLTNYICRLKFHLQTFTPGAVNITRSTVVHPEKIHFSSQSWSEVARKMAASKLTSKLTDNVAWTFFAKALCKGLTDSTEKIKVIYSQFHTMMNWNKTHGISPVGNDSTGNSARLNLIMIDMLRAVGVNADPVYISTVEHGKVDTTFISSGEFNSLIVIADVGDHSVLLDVGDPIRPWNLLSEQDLNYLGLRVTVTRNDTSETYSTNWVKITPPKNSSISISSTVNIDSVGNIKSKQVLLASEYDAMKFRERPINITIEDYIKTRLAISSGFDVSSQKVENERDYDKKLKIVFDLEKKAASAEQFLYINPFPIKLYADNPLHATERIYPVEFGFPGQRSISASIVIPANYKVSEVPKPLKLVLQDGSASFTLRVEQNDRNIQIVGVFNINNAVYQPDIYEDLRSLYAKMIDGLNSTIVLEKM